MDYIFIKSSGIYYELLFPVERQVTLKINHKSPKNVTKYASLPLKR